MLDSIKYLKVVAKPRYFENSEVNGVADDPDSPKMPFMDAKSRTWQFLIEIETGKILNWPTGTIAKIHYKVCDCGDYYILDSEHKIIKSIEDGYVPRILSPGGDGYGDYIIMNVPPDGKIENWQKDLIQKLYA